MIKARDLRCNAFTFVYFPDSSDDSNFLFDYLKSLKIPFAVSPLHDKDVNEVIVDSGHDFLIFDEGKAPSNNFSQIISTEYKKAHFHVVLWTDKVQKSYLQWLDLVSPLAHASLVDMPMNDPDGKYQRFFKRVHFVQNMRGLLRYFTHKDNPEKYQYNTEDITIGCGFDLENLLLSQSDSISLLREMIEFCRNNNVYVFCDFVDYCMEFNSEWFSCLASTKVMFLLKEYLKSAIYRDSGYIDKKVCVIEKYVESDD